MTSYIFQAERARAESSKISLLEENNILLHDLENTRDQLESLHKHFEEAEVKSKADIKLLVKEVKTLRGSQSDLKQELGHLMKEKLEVEVLCSFTISLLLVILLQRYRCLQYPSYIVDKTKWNQMWNDHIEKCPFCSERKDTFVLLVIHHTQGYSVVSSEI